MRVKKKELTEHIRLLQEANQLIEKKEQIPDGFELSECQELALKLGNTIEENYKKEETEDIIRALENYCECIWQLSLPENQDEDKLRKITQKINACLLNAERGITEGLSQDRKQVVFLPYKASMWDSLESIWIAARDDESVDAYVIPIPYYDKNPDGSFGEFHYEGDEYPDYVPITDWQEYSIPDERPDMVFIHNPYDEANYVTSVEQEFYSRELKKWTKCLVYVPYFVLDEIDPNDQNAIDEIIHFITVPAVVYADRVIVQSEAWKQVYVNEYIKFAVENNLGGVHVDREYQKKRILGLGSPKFDKILSTDASNIQIPEKWKEFIYKSDGSRKKVIFFNTGVGPFLKNSERMLIKILRIFDIFTKYREEVVLLWRPHPLLKQTINAMRPQLREKYFAVVNKFKQEELGIYDETSDLDRAIQISNAYYGDFSSVVELFKKSEKPILIVNLNSADVNEQVVFDEGRGNRGEKYIRLLICKCVEDEKYYYTIPSNYSCFMKISKKTRRAEYIYQIQGERIEQEFLYTDIYKDDNIIYAIPENAKKILKYDLETEQINYIDLPRIREVPKEKGWGLLYCSFEYGNYIYLFGGNYPGIIKFDKKSNTFYDIDLKICVRRQTIVEYNRQLYLINSDNLSFIVFDLNTEEIKFVKIPAEISWLTNIQEKIYVGCTNGDVFIWDIIKQNLEKSNYNVSEGTINDIAVGMENVIYVFQFNRPNVFKKIHINKLNEIESCVFPAIGLNEDDRNVMFAEKINKNIRIHSFSDRRIWILNTETGAFEIEKGLFAEKQMLYSLYYGSLKNAALERGEYSVYDFLETVMTVKETKRNKKLCPKIGYYIQKKLKEFL